MALITMCGVRQLGFNISLSFACQFPNCCSMQPANSKAVAAAAAAAVRRNQSKAETIKAQQGEWDLNKRLLFDCIKSEDETSEMVYIHKLPRRRFHYSWAKPTKNTKKKKRIDRWICNLVFFSFRNLHAHTLSEW